MKSAAPSNPASPRTMAAGTRLPTTPLRDALGTTVSLRTGRGPRLIVAVHSAACKPCRDYVAAIAAADLAAEWGGAVFAVPEEPDGDLTALERAAGTAVRVLRDPAGSFATGSAGITIADEWGEVYFAMSAGESHELTSVEEVGEWMRFIAIQCPECEGPEGGWKTM